jgi:hypothetical protein
MTMFVPEALFHKLGGSEDAGSGFAAIHSPALHTPYLARPGVVVLTRPSVNLEGLAGFLGGFDDALHFPAYLDDPMPLPDDTRLSVFSFAIIYTEFRTIDMNISPSMRLTR